MTLHSQLIKKSLTIDFTGPVTWKPSSKIKCINNDSYICLSLLKFLSINYFRFKISGYMNIQLYSHVQELKKYEKSSIKFSLNGVHLDSFVSWKQVDPAQHEFTPRVSITYS